MLPDPVAAQGFKAVAWKTREIGEGDGRVEYFQSFPALPIKALERPHEFALGQKLCAFVPEAEDHRAISLFAWTMYVKRKYQPGRSLFPGSPPPFAATKFSFGNLALTMIGVWLGA